MLQLGNRQFSATDDLHSHLLKVTNVVEQIRIDPVIFHSLLQTLIILSLLRWGRRDWKGALRQLHPNNVERPQTELTAEGPSGSSAHEAR